MPAELLFSAVTLAVVPAWLLLVLAPRWRHSAGLVSGVLVPVLLAATYAWLAFRYFPEADDSFTSLAGVRAAFGNDYILLAGWIHYLAFDLFVGSWEVRDSQRNGINHLVVVPCLILTFLLGPIGLLAYMVVRVSTGRRLDVDRTR